MSLYLYGASGHGKVIAEIAEVLHIKIGGFIDEDENINSVIGYEVFQVLPEDLYSIVISIGNNKIRKKIANQNPNLNYQKLCHPKSTLSNRAFIDRGTVVMAGATINSATIVGNHCIINTNASIDHDCIIENYVHISPNVALAGNVTVGEGTHIGIGASVIQGIKIGKWCTIGAGAVIIKDIPDYAVVVGNPGKIIKYNNE